MDSFEFDCNVLKLPDENSSSSPRFRHHLRKFKNLLRVIEISLVAAVLASAPSRLPSAVEYFRRFIGVVVSPLFIFLLSNVIVLTLYLKSRHHFPEHSRMSIENHAEFCQGLIRNGDDHNCTTVGTPIEPEEVAFQYKQTITEMSRLRSESSLNSRQLRTPETEKRRRRVVNGGEVEELSNEEFQRAIEAFIEKQIKFHQEEKGVFCFTAVPD